MLSYENRLLKSYLEAIMQVTRIVQNTMPLVSEKGETPQIGIGEAARKKSF